MKFKFCSDGDCPLWALAALHALSSLPVALFRTLLQHVMEEQPDDGIMEILKDTNLSTRDECARAAVVIRWVVQQSCACACSGAQLMRDLLVLGVPRAHASALADAVDNYRPEHEAYVQDKGFMINKLIDIAARPGPSGTVDVSTITLDTDDVFTGEQRSRPLLIEKTMALNLLNELKKAYQKMDEFDN